MSDIVNPGVARVEYMRGMIAASQWVLPPGAALMQIASKNNSANAVTGGLKFGTTAGGVQVLAALSLAALGINANVPLIPAISTAGQTIFVDAVLGWNNANVDVAFVYTQVF